MRQNNENTSVNLKLVMLFDWREQIYCICSHNLTPEASEEVTELRRDGLPAFTMNRSRHPQNDAEECEACRADVQQRVNPPPALERRKQDSVANRHLRLTNGITT
ncbi:MAG: hypothetical protein L0Z53_11100 [Acidobacteriales bacterium]|nr:hypothetical protein [Terriglobales bacterium]